MFTSVLLSKAISILSLKHPLFVCSSYSTRILVKTHQWPSWGHVLASLTLKTLTSSPLEPNLQKNVDPSTASGNSPLSRTWALFRGETRDSSRQLALCKKTVATSARLWCPFISVEFLIALDPCSSFLFTVAFENSFASYLRVDNFFCRYCENVSNRLDNTTRIGVSLARRPSRRTIWNNNERTLNNGLVGTQWVQGRASTFRLQLDIKFK